MLITDQDKATCEKHSAEDEEGFAHCYECPLRVKNAGMFFGLGYEGCKANCHWNWRLQRWVPDEEDEEC